MYLCTHTYTFVAPGYGDMHTLARVYRSRPIEPGATGATQDYCPVYTGLVGGGCKRSRCMSSGLLNFKRPKMCMCVCARTPRVGVCSAALNLPRRRALWSPHLMYGDYGVTSHTFCGNEPVMPRTASMRHLSTSLLIRMTSYSC